MLRKSILDPQGKAVHHAFENLGMPAVKDVRIGKYIELRLDCSNQKEAENVTDQACKKLLANPVMEDYSFSIEKVSEK
jgi:phosphoribosylformylglycinamidine synthase PurS subunit